MTDKDYAPLSAHCVRALCDKMYDKRKAAALEIEKLTKDCIQINNQTQVQKLLRVLGTEFASSQNPNMRKGGLIGLAAMAIGMGKDSHNYVNELVKPVLNCMDDTDCRVRFYACESLYNVTKVTRDEVLPLFNDLFIAMAKVVTDLDQGVRTAAELLVRLMKDIVTENADFSTAKFVPTLKQCMYTDDQFGRSFCIGWVDAMHKVPNPTIVKYLPDLLDPMFLFLGDSEPIIVCRCQRELVKFLHLVKQDPPKKEAFDNMINCLVVHVQSTNIKLQTMAIHWIRAFVTINGSWVFPYTSGILSAVLPNLRYEETEEKRRNATEDEGRRTSQMATHLYFDLMKVVENYSPELTNPDSDPKDLRQLEAILDVSVDELQHGKTESKIGALNWINLLFTLVPRQMREHIDKIFPTLLKSLSDSNDEVVILDLRVLSVICKPSGNRHFGPFMISLYTLFKADRNLLEVKGAYIIRQLSIYLGPEDIYKSLAEMVQKEKDVKFARCLVEYLNVIMFTTPELASLRESIKTLETPESKNLFITLHKTWSHSQASIIALVFLAGCYKHALRLVHEISEMEVTLEFLYELDRFIQIMESPIFSFLRYELLDPENHSELIGALYGLLNLMPQTTAFRILNDRLKTLPNSVEMRKEPEKKIENKVGNKHPSDIDFNQLLENFLNIQALHEHERLKEVSKDIVTLEEAEKLFKLKLSESENVEYTLEEFDEHK